MLVTTFGNNILRILVSTVWQILLLRRGPQGLPSAPLFVALIAGANLLVSLLVSTRFDSNSEIPTLALIASIAVSLATQAALVYFALWVRNVPNRFNPTLAALFACDLVLTALLGIAIGLAGGFDDQSASLTNQLIALAHLIWFVAVGGWVLHHALESSFFVAVLLVIGIYIFALAMSTQAVAL
ncbi:MAG: hypothetical protein NXH85_01135 [Pseudomonadaceae bacterium]|nr:hypothetical protein [Pseudomonadaceae bacterium]